MGWLNKSGSVCILCLVSVVLAGPDLAGGGPGPRWGQGCCPPPQKKNPENYVSGKQCKILAFFGVEFENFVIFWANIM